MKWIKILLTSGDCPKFKGDAKCYWKFTGVGLQVTSGPHAGPRECWLFPYTNIISTQEFEK